MLYATGGLLFVRQVLMSLFVTPGWPLPVTAPAGVDRDEAAGHDGVSQLAVGRGFFRLAAKAAGMVFLVPYDGSSPAREALERAIEYAGALDRDVVAVSYIPTGNSYAERRQWVDPEENFAIDTATQDLERKIEEATDDTELRYDDVSAHSPAGGFSPEVRQTASDVDASVLFVGGDDESVAVPVGEATDEVYDVHVVRG